MRGDIDPGNLFFRARVVGIVEMWKDYDPGMEPFPPREGRDLDVWPEGPVSPCAGFMSPNQSAITESGSSFHTVRGGIDPCDLCFRARVVGVVGMYKDF